MTNQKFTPGEQLSTRSIGDWNCEFQGHVIKRTAKTVTIYTRMNGEARCKIHLDDDGNEFVFPYGRYSMSPVFRAGRSAQ